MFQGVHLRLLSALAFYYTDRFHTGFLLASGCVSAGIHRHAIAHHLYREIHRAADHACGHAADNLYRDRALSAIQVGRQTGVKGVPIAISALLGCAVLTKGPVGIILPLFVFGVYLLMLRKYSYLVIFKALLYAGISSSMFPASIVVCRCLETGEAIRSWNVMLAENFGRFFHLSTPDIHYNLGHENGVWYNFMTLAAGFVPWTIFFFFLFIRIKTAQTRKVGERDTG